MSMARIYKKGQITIPKAVREATGFNVGDRVIVEEGNDEIVLRHPIGVLEFTPQKYQSIMVNRARHGGA